MSDFEDALDKLDHRNNARDRLLKASELAKDIYVQRVKMFRNVSEDKMKEQLKEAKNDALYLAKYFYGMINED